MGPLAAIRDVVIHLVGVSQPDLDALAGELAKHVRNTLGDVRGYGGEGDVGHHGGDEYGGGRAAVGGDVGDVGEQLAGAVRVGACLCDVRVFAKRAGWTSEGGFDGGEGSVGGEPADADAVLLFAAGW